MINNSNNGMFLETVINNSCLYYKNNQIALIFKRNIPIKIIKKNSEHIIGKLIDNAETDYYGIYQGYYFDFEAKQTIKNEFLLSNLKQHQLSHLIEVSRLRGISFLLLYFVRHDEYYAIDANLLKDVKVKITRDWCINHAYALKLYFPARLNIIDFVKLFINS